MFFAPLLATTGLDEAEASSGFDFLNAVATTRGTKGEGVFLGGDGVVLERIGMDLGCVLGAEGRDGTLSSSSDEVSSPSYGTRAPFFKTDGVAFGNDDVLGSKGVILARLGVFAPSPLVVRGMGLAGFLGRTPSLLGSEITLGEFFTKTGGLGGFISGVAGFVGNWGPITVGLVVVAGFVGRGEGGEIFDDEEGEDEVEEDTDVEGLEDEGVEAERMELRELGCIS